MYEVTLSNGTRIKNLVLNGNNFVSEAIIPNSAFDGGLDTVIISDGKTEKTYSDMVLLSNRVDDGKSWFILGEKTEAQKKEEALNKYLEEIGYAINILLGI